MQEHSRATVMPLLCLSRGCTVKIWLLLLFYVLLYISSIKDLGIAIVYGNSSCHNCAGIVSHQQPWACSFGTVDACCELSEGLGGQSWSSFGHLALLLADLDGYVQTGLPSAA